MARCANCGCEIPNEDKTRLCDECKRVILPFIKFMEASTTPAVKRLLSNEKNLRNAGVTDNGMDYLYRICELQDRKRQSEQEAKAMSRTAAAYGQTPAGRNNPAAEEPARPEPRASVEQAERPDPADGFDEEETEREKVPGAGLEAAKWVMILAGTAALVWFCAKILTRAYVGESRTDSIDVAALCVSFTSYAGAYTAGVVRKMLAKTAGKGMFSEENGKDKG